MDEDVNILDYELNLQSKKYKNIIKEMMNEIKEREE